MYNSGYVWSVDIQKKLTQYPVVILSNIEFMFSQILLSKFIYIRIFKANNKSITEHIISKKDRMQKSQVTNTFNLYPNTFLLLLFFIFLASNGRLRVND